VWGKVTEGVSRERCYRGKCEVSQHMTTGVSVGQKQRTVRKAENGGREEQGISKKGDPTTRMLAFDNSAFGHLAAQSKKRMRGASGKERTFGRPREKKLKKCTVFMRNFSPFGPEKRERKAASSEKIWEKKVREKKKRNLVSSRLLRGVTGYIAL